MKLEAISIDESKPAPLFQVICRPDQELKIAAAADADLSEREKFNVEFWSDVIKKCLGKLPGFINKKPPRYHYLGQATGKSGLQLVLIATSKYYGVELYIDTQDADLNESILRQIEKHQTEIETAFGSKLQFDDIPEKRACRIKCKIKSDFDFTKADINKVQDDLIENMIKFEKIMKPIINKLSYAMLDAA